MTKVNEHAKIIADTVFHTFPYNQMIPNFQGPHAEDCGGCIINAQVEVLVAELDRLSPIKSIVADLENKKKELELLTLDRRRAFEKAGITEFKKAGVAEEDSITDLVTSLVRKHDQLVRVIKAVRNGTNTTAELLNELQIDEIGS